MKKKSQIILFSCICMFLIFGGILFFLKTEEKIEPIYRALIIGEKSYEVTLHGPEQDILAMKDILTKNQYEVIDEIDAGKQDIFNLIEVLCLDATENDITLFYYSGHGNLEDESVEFGAMQTVDMKYLTSKELLEQLCEVPGKIVIILDSCGSGQIIQELSSGNWPKDKFFALTASTDTEKSITLFKENVWGGQLTRGISSAVGRDYVASDWKNELVADIDKDSVITLEELYAYCCDFIREENNQHIQVFPKGCNLPVFVEKK